jgi:hypothetical protein
MIATTYASKISRILEKAYSRHGGTFKHSWQIIQQSAVKISVWRKLPTLGNTSKTFNYVSQT